MTEKLDTVLHKTFVGIIIFDDFLRKKKNGYMMIRLSQAFN